jgi:hypothetical protein
MHKLLPYYLGTAIKCIPINRFNIKVDKYQEVSKSYPNKLLIIHLYRIKIFAVKDDN